jgi:flagella basal body P-ring formation protein FlgA
MIRVVSIALLFAFTGPAAAQVTASILPMSGPILKREVTVASDIVRIGDLVENAGVVANVPIFRAPDLGQTGHVSAERVIEAVRPHHIIGLETQGIVAVSVTRASRTISAAEIKDRVLHSIARQYNFADPRDLMLIFDHEVKNLQLEPTSTADLKISHLAYDPRTRRFDVTIEIPGASIVRRQVLRYGGSVIETAEGIVLARPVAQGEVIKPSDVTQQRRPKSEIANNVVTDLNQVVGFAARRALRSGQPVQRADLVKAEVIKRNETVTIVFEVPGIFLTVRGKALEAGAQGDVINVENIQSKRSVQATVVGPGRVVAKVTSMTAAATAPVAPRATVQLPRTK